MINIESLVFDTVCTQLSTSHPEANISDGYYERMATYPNLVVIATGNVPYQSANTDDCAENCTRVTFQLEATSNKTGTARSECVKLLADADTVMQSMKFRRTYMSEPQNIDRTIWRRYARYEAIVGKPYKVNEGQQNEKTVYQMYRR